MIDDKIECKGGVTFLKINVFGESQHLNPFRINTNQIRYIRKYTDMKGDGWAVIVGDKMYPTRDLNFDGVEVGDVIKIGNTDFECAITTSLTERQKYKTLVNYQNVLYVRKYLKKDNKNDSNNVESSDNLDKFAIVTVDERVIPLINELESDVRSNDGVGSSREGAPATT
jgi:hypothetical protein